jgi:uncharacterized protein HemX
MVRINGEGWVHQLDRLSNTIGHGTLADVKLPKESASSLHAEISVWRQRWWLAVYSRLGVIVNDEMVGCPERIELDYW